MSCQGGRVTALDLTGFNASGPLEGFGLLTALTDLRLAYNRFSGARERVSGSRQPQQLGGFPHPQRGFPGAGCSMGNDQVMG